MTLVQSLTQQLRDDEGERSTAYQDHLGYWTIGVGRLIDGRKPGAGLRPSEIAFLLQNDIEDRIKQLTQRIPWFAQLDEVRQGVLLNMAFQLGVEGLLGFHNTLAMIGIGMYEKAAQGMLQSKWATQTPARAKRLSEQMRTGQWVFQ